MNFINSLIEKELTLNGDEKYPLLRLGDFFRLEILRKALLQSAKDKDKRLFSTVLLKITELQTKKEYIPKSLLEALQNATKIITMNIIVATPNYLVVKEDETDSTDEIPVWDYEGRTLAVWINDFAELYGWSLEEILNLPVNTAVYLYQEIMVTKQLQKEWQYSLTELAYKYNESSQKSDYVALPRPKWMTQTVSNVPVKLKTTKMRIDMLPFGVVVDYSGLGVLSNNEQNQNLDFQNPKETPTPN